jgi:hypothetical protein
MEGGSDSSGPSANGLAHQFDVSEDIRASVSTVSRPYHVGSCPQLPPLKVHLQSVTIVVKDDVSKNKMVQLLLLGQLSSKVSNRQVTARLPVHLEARLEALKQHSRL